MVSWYYFSCECVYRYMNTCIFLQLLILFPWCYLHPVLGFPLLLTLPPPLTFFMANSSLCPSFPAVPPLPLLSANHSVLFVHMTDRGAGRWSTPPKKQPLQAYMHTETHLCTHRNTRTHTQTHTLAHSGSRYNRVHTILSVRWEYLNTQERR